MLLTRNIYNCFRRKFSSKSIVISDSVRSAISNNEPVVALESTIITHGMPRPDNLRSAQSVQNIIKNEVKFSIF